MADSGTVTYEHVTHSSVKRLRVTWLCTAGGVAELTVKEPIDGVLGPLVTDPDGTDAPSDNYGITILDDNGYDILNSQGLLRDTANTESTQVFSDADTAAQQRMYTPSFVFKVAAAGISKRGVATLYYR